MKIMNIQKNTFETRFIKGKYVAVILKTEVLFVIDIVNIILFASKINANARDESDFISKYYSHQQIKY